MMEFLLDNIEVVNTGLNAIMVLIWTAYLHFFLINHLQGSRSIIHIDIGAARGASSRCLVTNLSAKPVYIQGLVVELANGDQTTRTIVTDRNEISSDDVQDPLALTNRGTLQPGGTVDIGSLSDLVCRAGISLSEDWSTDRVTSLTITIVAISGQADRIVGATKTFDATHGADDIRFSPQNILTDQMRPRQTRERFSQILRDEVQA